MTTPDTPPPQLPLDASRPEAADAVAVASDQGAAMPAAPEPVSNGHQNVERVEQDRPAGDDAQQTAPAEEPAEGAAPPQHTDGQPEHGEKKRRRRRRKRKPGAPAAGEAASHEHGEEAAADAPAEDGAGADAVDVADHAAAPPRAQKKK